MVVTIAVEPAAPVVVAGIAVALQQAQVLRARVPEFRPVRGVAIVAVAVLPRPQERAVLARVVEAIAAPAGG